MAFGLRSLSKNGNMQIDGEFKNVAYVGKVIIPASAWSNGRAVVSIPDHDFVFLGHTGGSFVTLRSNQKAGSGRSLEVLISEPATVNLYLYARQEPASGGFGLNVYGASGQAVFSSNDNHLSILGSLNGPASSESGTYRAPLSGQSATIALPPTPSLKGQLQPQGQILMMLYLMTRAIRVDETSGLVEVGAVRRLAGVTDWVSGHGAWTFPSSFATGYNVIVAGHFGQS